MKFSQEPPVFQPVVITFETLEEVEALKEVVQYYIDCSKTPRDSLPKVIADSIKWRVSEVLDDE